jgi:hypothetical protein
MFQAQKQYLLMTLSELVITQSRIFDCKACVLKLRKLFSAADEFKLVGGSLSSALSGFLGLLAQF